MPYPRLCCECGILFMGGARSLRCLPCRYQRQLETNRQYKERVRNNEHRPVGSTAACSVCGQEYVVTGGLQKYCPDCAPSEIKAVCTRQSLDHYHAHRDAICERRRAEYVQGTKQRRWTDAERATLAQLIRQGLTHAECAARLSRSVRAIDSQASIFRLRKKRKGEVDAK